MLRSKLQTLHLGFGICQGLKGATLLNNLQTLPLLVHQPEFGATESSREACKNDDVPLLLGRTVLMLSHTAQRQAFNRFRAVLRCSRLLEHSSRAVCASRHAHLLYTSAGRYLLVIQISGALCRYLRRFLIDAIVFRVDSSSKVQQLHAALAAGTGFDGWI